MHRGAERKKKGEKGTRGICHKLEGNEELRMKKNKRKGGGSYEGEIRSVM